MVEKSEKPGGAPQKHANADETRKAIFEAALEEFALRSVEGARTRDIARRANVNHAAINYHFGSKRRMYEHVIKDTIQYFADYFAPLVAEVEEFLEKDGKNAKKAIEFIKKILIFHHSFFYNPGFSSFYLLVKREELFPSSAFETVFKKGFKPMHHNFVRLVDVASGFTRTKKENSMIAISLIGLNGSLNSCKVGFLRMNGQDELKKDDVDLFCRICCEAVDRLFK